jgi:hypothetical protein
MGAIGAGCIATISNIDASGAEGFVGTYGGGGSKDAGVTGIICWPIPSNEMDVLARSKSKILFKMESFCKISNKTGQVYQIGRFFHQKVSAEGYV